MRTACLLVLSAAFAMAGCGQKGPLYLRDNPPPGAVPKKHETYEPVPYPKQQKSDGASSDER